jgi:glutathione reductase (NADPH)
MTRSFDLIVIGSGSAAGSVASRCRAAGWTVAMIDKQPFGGTCALRGCDPKKVLVGAAAAVDAARALSGKGLHPNGLAIDWAELMRFKRTFTDPYPDKRKSSLAHSGIETFDGALHRPVTGDRRGIDARSHASDCDCRRCPAGRPADPRA